MIVTVKEMKNYLRVDHEDDDRLLSDLIEQGQQICMDVARIADEDVFEEQGLIFMSTGKKRIIRLLLWDFGRCCLESGSRDSDGRCLDS